MATSINKGIIALAFIICSALLWLLFTVSNLPADKAEVINKSHALKRQNFTLPDLNGQQQEFSQWNDKVVLLNFWATWCPPCRREMPDFVEVYNQYKDKGFVIVGVGTDAPQKVAAFVKQLNVSYPILVGERQAMQISYQYGNHSGALPYSIIIDRQGIIRYRAGGWMSRQKLLSQIEPLLD